MPTFYSQTVIFLFSFQSSYAVPSICSCARIFFFQILCIFTQKTMSRTKMGSMRYSLMPMFITMAS